MPDRLAELRRQRALVHEHLAWLDREIAAAGKSSRHSPADHALISPAAPAPVDAPQPLATATTATAPDQPPSAPIDAETLLDQYRHSPGSLQSEVRRGCLLYFIGAFALLVLGVTVLYFLVRTR